MGKEYVFFYGGPFSQWARSIFFDENGQKYYTAEQYMMARKALVFNDTEVYNAIMNTQNPMEQKALGRKVRNFDADRWAGISRKVVTSGNILKFTQNPEFKKHLLETEYKTIVEASPTDTIWGIGLSVTDPRRFNESEWRGTNWLGECLMEVRRIIG